MSMWASQSASTLHAVSAAPEHPCGMLRVGVMTRLCSPLTTHLLGPFQLSAQRAQMLGGTPRLMLATRPVSGMIVSKQVRRSTSRPAVCEKQSQSAMASSIEVLGRAHCESHGGGTKVWHELCQLLTRTEAILSGRDSSGTFFGIPATFQP